MATYKPYDQKKRGDSVVLLILMVFVIWLIMHLALHSEPIREPSMISHRGAAAFAPENTLAGISEAINRGALFVEVDVQRSADGVLILIHDSTVDRTTDGIGQVGELTWDQIRVLDAGSHFSPRFAGEPIPTLDSVLELIAEKPVTLVLEAKNPGLYPEIEQQIAEALQRFNAYDQVIVISFDHDWLERFHEIAPEVPLGRLWVWMGNIQQRSMITLVDVHWTNVIADPTLVRRAHRQGYAVVAWVVNNPWCMKLLLWLGVDGITTDNPDRWTEAIGLHQ